MPELLKKIGLGIAGAFTGLFGGIAAGFIPGYHYLLRRIPSWSSGEYAGFGIPFLILTVAFVVTLPFFMVYQMARGVITGMLNGPLAGLTCAKTRHMEFVLDRKNDKLLDAIKDIQRASKHGHHDARKQLLSQDEIESVRDILKNDPNQKESFEQALKEYADRLIGMNLEEEFPEQPVIIETKDKDKDGKVIVKHYLVEAQKMYDYATRCADEGKPMVIEVNGKIEKITKITNADISHPTLRQFERLIQYVRTTLAAKNSTQNLMGGMGASKAKSAEKTTAATPAKKPPTTAKQQSVATVQSSSESHTPPPSSVGWKK